MMTKKQKQVVDGDSEESSKSLLPSLPFHIVVYDILTRIPIDCLLSFRSVCKLWSSLILNDSDFIKLHSTRTYASPGFLDLSGNYPDSRFYVKGSDDENSDNGNFDDENSVDKNSDDENSDDENSDDEEDGEPELEETEPFQDWMRGVKKSNGISFYDIGKKFFWKGFV
ncbi:hypothetical protein MKX03_032743 [Papaver bracteatum]|nr:hypothetical protein MKX03_032743 [Papaver bracteatum]